LNRGVEVAALLRASEYGHDLKCLATNNDEAPQHPLYITDSRRTADMATSRMKGFIVLDKTYTPDREARYVQFDDECETFEQAQKLARFLNLRDPIIVNLEVVEEIK
jgi:hypothetical protein